MNLTELKRELQNGKINNLYIFTGDELGVMDIYINQISKLSNSTSKRIEDVTPILSGNRGLSFIPTKYCYVLRDDKTLRDVDILTKILKSLGNNILILIYSDIDKRGKLYKEYKDIIVTFEYLSQDLLTKYIQKDIDLSDDSCASLSLLCGMNYSRILLEINKILHFSANENMEYDEALKTLIDDGTIYKEPEDAIFDLVDSILDRKINTSYYLYEQCKGVGEANLVVLSVLYSNAKALLQVQSCTSSNIEKATGLTGWQIKNAKKHINKYTNGELVRMMRLVRQLEIGVKVGDFSDDMVINYLFANIF